LANPGRTSTQLNEKGSPKKREKKVKKKYMIFWDGFGKLRNTDTSLKEKGTDQRTSRRR